MFQSLERSCRPRKFRKGAGISQNRLATLKKPEKVGCIGRSKVLTDVLSSAKLDGGRMAALEDRVFRVDCNQIAPRTGTGLIEGIPPGNTLQQDQFGSQLGSEV